MNTNWDDLPIVNGEDGRRYNDLMARYGHQFCPGTLDGNGEDVCAAPWDCASKGRCRLIFERNKE